VLSEVTDKVRFGEIPLWLEKGYGGSMLHLQAYGFIDCKMFFGTERVRLACQDR
jgi:hypothetical protein